MLRACPVDPGRTVTERLGYSNRLYARCTSAERGLGLEGCDRTLHVDVDCAALGMALAHSDCVATAWSGGRRFRPALDKA